MTAPTEAHAAVERLTEFAEDFPNFKVVMPMPEKLREISLAWIERIGPTLIDRWPSEVLALSMPTKFVRFPIGIINDLFEHHKVVPASIQELAATLDAEMEWRRCFIRLNSRSPKDALWPFEVGATCSGKEAMKLLGSSERILDDLARFEYIPEHPAFICLRDFVPGLQPEREFRCFVKEGELIAVSAYDYLRPTEPPADGGKDIRHTIEQWFNNILKPRLHLSTVVFDVFLDWDGGILLIELNPYGLSDPCFLRSYDQVESFSGFVACGQPASKAAAPVDRESRDEPK